MSKKRSRYHARPSRPRSSTLDLSPRVATVLAIMASTMICTILVSNLAAMKIWNLASIPVDGGIIMFPVTYILGDLLVDIYGKRIANTVSTCSFILGLAVCGLLWIVTLLPDYPGVDNSGFVVVSGMASRITLASLISFVLSQRANNSLFAYLRFSMVEDNFKARAFLSSVVAHLVDVAVFETIAFAGRLPMHEFVHQIVFAYLAGLLLETLLLPLTNYLAKTARQKLHFSNGQSF